MLYSNKNLGKKSNYTNSLGVKDQMLGFCGWNEAAEKLVRIANAMGMKCMIYQSNTI